MKKTQFFFFLILLSLSAISQNTFFKWYPSDKHDYIYNALELTNGNFILCGEQYENVSTMTRGYLLMINQNGDLLQQNLYEDSDTASSHALIYKLSNEEDIFNTVTNQIIYSNGHINHIQSFNKYTINLDLLSCKKIASALDYEVLPQAVLVWADTSIIIQSELVSYLPPYHIIGSLVTKYNLQFDSLGSFYKPGNYLFSFGLIADTITNTIKCFSVNMNTYATKLNTYMQLLGEAVLPFFVSSTSATKFSDSKYLLTGTVMDKMYVKQHIKVRLYDENDIPIDSVAYYNHPDTILYSGAVCNTAIVGDKIFVVGNYNIDPSQWPWQNSPTWIQITRLDSNLQILDHHFYGGDAVYMPWKILSTLDGNAIIFGNRYDYNVPNERKYHPFALKVNELGLITELPNQHQAKAHDAILYPNPGSDCLNIQAGPQINGAQFTLYDMQGLAVLKEEINNTQLKLNTSNLPSGIYPWQIVFKSKVIEGGKWVK